MVKVMIDDPMFKKGSYTGQKDDGLYMDGVLVEAVSIFAKKIVDDMQFLGLFCSSTFGVRTGKSTLAQQLCYYYTSEVNRMHGLDLKFDHKHIVFKAEDLIDKAHQFPPYSAIILDEGDDLTEHSASEKMKELKKFMRKSGQLNLFIIFILPDYFEMPKSIAMHRSNFLIDVKFEGEFERGHFDYYNFTDKKKLYAKGKKFGDYEAQKATISGGRFVNKYCVDEAKYRKMKRDDLNQKNEKEDQKYTRSQLTFFLTEYFSRVYLALKETHEVTIPQAAKAFGIARSTGENYLQAYRKNLASKEKDEDRGQASEDSVVTKPTTQKVNDTIILTTGEGGDAVQEPVQEPNISKPEQPETKHLNSSFDKNWNEVE